MVLDGTPKVIWHLLEQLNPRETTGIWNQEIFQGWTGDSESTSFTGTVLMNGPKIITVEWKVDNSIAIFNGGIIAIAAVVGLFLYTQFIPILSNTLQLMPNTQIQDNYHNFSHI